MPPSRSPAPSLNSESGASRRGRRAALAAFAVLALACIGINSANFRSFAEAAAILEHNARLLAADSVQPGACAPLARQAPPILFEPDSFCWVAYAQEQASQGGWRTRWTVLDNSPGGRAVHWSSGLVWWLRGTGALNHAFTGAPMPQAIAAAAAWANPALFALGLLALGWVVHRKAGVWTAGVLTVTLAALQGVEWDFSYGRPDHHGLHLIAFLGMFVSALAAGLGWVREGGASTAAAGADEPLLTRAPDRRQARRWFFASGVFGGMGLWIGATQQMFMIGAVGAGAALGALCFARPPSAGEESRFAPELWREWARAGAAASFAFYLLEYFPDRMTMRLEVNHPLYALAWLGGGELICALGRWRVEGRIGRTGVLLGLGAMAALPVAVVLGPSEWYVLRDPVQARIFRTVMENDPWIARWTLASPGVIMRAMGLLPLALPLAAGRLLWRRRQATPPQRAALVMGLGVSAMTLAWALYQTRWLGFADAALAVLALIIVPSAWAWRGRALKWGLLALAAPGWGLYWHTQSMTYGDPPSAHAKSLLNQMLVWQEVAWNLRLYAGDKLSPTVMAPLAAGPALAYFGGVPTVGSLYWENLPGCRAALDFYNDPGDAAARRMARERDLDFVIAVAKPRFVQQARWINHGPSADSLGEARKTLAFRLSNPVNAQPPAWLEPLPFLEAPLALRDGVRLYRVRRERL